MKRVVSLFITMAVMLSAVCFPSFANAATEYVTVYLNEKAIDFPPTDARPQIFSNRTYVPVRKTCEALGLTVDWNSKTETLTFNREGVVISHTMRSTIVYVNGEAVNFDTPSINKNNRTLMPIRMLAESIGAVVTWDNPTRSVHITTNESVVVTPSTPVAANVSVNSLTVDKQSVNTEDTVTFTAIANSSTDKVKFVNASNSNEIGESDEYVANSDGTRTFIFEHKCVNDTNSPIILNVQAIPGTASAYSDTASASKTVGVIISNEKTSGKDENSENGDYKSEYMLSCKLLTPKVQTDSNARIKIKTTDDVRRVRITNDFNKRAVTEDEYDEDSDENRTFNCEVEMTEEGKQKLYVYLYVTRDGDYEEVYETLTVDVDDDYDEDDVEYDELEIIDLWTNNDYGYKGYDTTVYVKTSKDVDFLELLREGQEPGEGITRSATEEKFSNYYYWEFPFEIKQTGSMKYTLLAYNEDEDYVSETFKLEGRPFEKYEPAVLSIEQKSSTVIEGDDVSINVVCTGVTDRIRVTRGTSNTLYESSSEGSKSSATKTFKATFQVDDIDDDYYVTAYDSSDNYDRMRFRITGEVYSEINIVDYDLEDDDIDEGDLVNISIVTSNSCEKLWIEDDRGGRVSAIYSKPKREKNNNYEWEVTFSPINEGRNTYTIIAEDDNDNQDTDDFVIRVR